VYSTPVAAEPAQLYTLLNINTPFSGAAYLVIFYNTDMDFIGYVSTSAGVTPPSWTFTTPANTAFMRVDVPSTSVNAGTSAANYGVFKGAVSAFTPYNMTDANAPTKTLLRIIEPSGVVHSFSGTTSPADVGGSVYFIASDPSDTAENLREALLNNVWLAANFNVRIPFVWLGNTPNNGTVLNIKSKGAGTDYNLTIQAPGNAGNVAYVITAIHATSLNNDSISGEASTAEIELDIYTDPAVFLGQDDRPITSALLGTYAVSLQKTYVGVPVWFELNALFAQYGGFKIPGAAPGWYDTGTMQAYRFVAKKKALNSFSFYQSAALFVVNGYGPASEDLNLSEYTYGGNLFNLLTNKPTTPYVRGQRAFLNFIFKDVERGITGADDFTIRVAYRAYSTGGTYLGILYAHPVTRTALNMVNTCVLNIDAVIDAYPKTGFVRVNLMKDQAVLTNDLVYQVRPDCLHKLTQFVFLNRLGGWDAFNFDAAPQSDIKPTSETFSKTITPGFKKGDSVETVYSTDLAHTVTVEGAPVLDDVADWLKELAAARVVLDGEGNYIVIEDFNLKTSATSQDMQVPTIKYHLSETFTND
jgi:hypothetical protein